MLPRKERLSRKDFNRFFSVAKRSDFPLFQLAHVSHDSLHVSVVVSKKVAPRSVDRNRLRRRMYDIVRRSRDDHPFTGVCIFVMKSKALISTHEELKQSVHAALKKVA